MEKSQIKSDKDPNSESYKRGHSLGYMLAQMDPATAKDFADIQAKVPILEGFKAGKENYEREQKARVSELAERWLHPDPIKDNFNDKSREQEKNIDRDRDR